MKAYLFNGPDEMIFKEVRDPRIISSTDAIIKVSHSAICGMDIKIRKGFLPEVCPGTILGHEFSGTVMETGSSVRKFKSGDAVAVSPITSCGYCENCRNGKNEKCINGGWLLGYSIDGCQAEYVRVPFADRSLTSIPSGVSLKDAVLAGDIGASGYQAALNAKIKEGDSVVVTGSGPAATMAMMCARTFRPSILIAVDSVPERLEKIHSYGIADAAVDMLNADPVNEVMRLLGGKKADSVIEATGLNSNFKKALELSKDDGSISVLSIYSDPLIFSATEIKNRWLTLNTRRIGANAVSKVLELMGDRTIDTAFLFSGTGTLDGLEEGYMMTARKDAGFFKWICDHEGR
ncbi:MAG TPA: alcohol dehydrogenase catalytic domain-containing protein [bacterium]|nr:alcohol dehydrogenase catalytic domain-containing protein [bacterium]